MTVDIAHYLQALLAQQQQLLDQQLSIQQQNSPPQVSR